MLTLPTELSSLIVAFQPVFSKSVWKNAQDLLVRAILAPGKQGLSHPSNGFFYELIEDLQFA